MSTIAERQNWMATLARAPRELLEERMSSLAPLPAHSPIRPAEVGLVMVRGRAGGRGQPFNLGEMTMTRCVVRVDVGEEEPAVGFGYVAGRSKRHAELAALGDALLQSARWHERVQAQVLAPVEAEVARRRARKWQETAATEVKFVGLVRGE